jgi:hypothetical protein
MAAPKRKLCSNCEKKPLRADNESGICNACRRAPAKRRASKPASTSVSLVSPAASATTKLARPAKSSTDDGYGYLATETVDNLVAALAKIDQTRAAVFAELRRRREEISAALGMDKAPSQGAA